MNIRISRLALCSAAAVGVVAALALTGDAQTQRRGGASFSPGRLWDGKTPDFRGIWQVRDTAYVNIEGHPGGNGIAAARSIIVDPPDGKIPYKPEALKQRQENYRNRATADPSSKCYHTGFQSKIEVRCFIEILKAGDILGVQSPNIHKDVVVDEDAVPILSGCCAVLR
jgi:hypothetical protein